MRKQELSRERELWSLELGARSSHSGYSGAASIFSHFPVACRFLAGSSDSDSDDRKRVVRSAKDRRYEELRGTCEELRVSLCCISAT